MSPKARALRAEHASLTALAREEQAVADFARAAAKRPLILNGTDLMTYKEVQLAALEAGSITLKTFRTRVRRAARRLTEDLRGRR